MSLPRSTVGEADASGEDARRSSRPPAPCEHACEHAREHAREQTQAIAHFLEPDAVAFVDAERVRWRVVERDARRDPGARAARCLVFDCGEAVRRVWSYPADWRRLPPEALAALSWSR